MDSSRAPSSSYSNLAPILIGIAVAGAAILLLALTALPSGGQVDVDAQRPEAPVINAPQIDDNDSDADGHMVIRIDEPLTLTSSHTVTPTLAAIVVTERATGTEPVFIDLSSTPRVIRTATPAHTPTPVGRYPTSAPPTRVPATQGPEPTATETMRFTPTAEPTVNPTRTPRPVPTPTRGVATRTPAPIVNSPTPAPVPPTATATVATSTSTVVPTGTAELPTATETIQISPTLEVTATVHPSRTQTSTPDPTETTTPGFDDTQTPDPATTFASPEPGSG